MPERLPRCARSRRCILRCGARSPRRPTPPDAPRARRPSRRRSRRALERNPTVGEAAQAILRARGAARPGAGPCSARRSSAPSARPSSTPRAGSTATSPSRARSRPSARPCPIPFLAADALGRARARPPTRWASRGISAEETRRQVGLTAAAGLPGGDRRPSASGTSRCATGTRRGPSPSTPRARLEAGQGSRLNHVRSSQELAHRRRARRRSAELAVRQAQEALGIAIFADGARRRERASRTCAAGRAAVRRRPG